MLAQAVLDLFPGATFAIGPPVEDGFYYDFQLPPGDDGKPATFKPEDLDRIEVRMREILAEAQPFVRDELTNDKAREVFADHPFKLEIIDGEADDPTSVTASGVVRTYENPPAEPKDDPPFHGYPGFIDLCRGPHVPDTGRFLGHFKLMRVAGAYWRGDEHKPMLQRIYGTAWASKADLDEHLDATRGGREARPPQAGQRARPPVVPRRARWRPRRLAPQGRHRPQADGGLQPGAPPRVGGYEFVYTPHIAKSRPVRDQRAPRELRRRHVPADGARRTATTTRSR